MALNLINSDDIEITKTNEELTLNLSEEVNKKIEDTHLNNEYSESDNEGYSAGYINQKYQPKIIMGKDDVNLTISANSYAFQRITAPQSGYALIGITFERNSENSDIVSVSVPILVDGDWRTRIHNISTRSITLTGTLYSYWAKIG